MTEEDTFKKLKQRPAKEALMAIMKQYEIRTEGGADAFLKDYGWTWIELCHSYLQSVDKKV